MSSPTLRAAVAALRRGADPARARLMQRYFKTGPGEYGEGDVFLGLAVPEVRCLARACRELSLADLGRLLASRYHEERLLALFVLVLQAERADDRGRARICRFYLARTVRVNNWDLVDCSAPQIVGRHLENRSRAPLRRLAASRSLWERRIAVLATFHFIRRGEFADALAVAAMLLRDPEDLIHKAVGWMLREVGRRSRKVEEAFLRRHAPAMPRTMLRYALERFPQALRRRYLRMR